MDDQHEPRLARQQKNTRSTAGSTSRNWRVRDNPPQQQQPKPQEPEAQQDQRSSSTYNSRLYVGNLLYSVQREDVAHLFSDNGFTSVQVDMSIDPMTGRNPSYCFVELESAEDASAAMTKLNGQNMRGRPVRIKPGVPKKQTGHGDGKLRVRSHDRGWEQLESSGPASSGSSQSPAFDRWSRQDASSFWVKPVEESQRVYVGQLPRMEPQSAVDKAMQEFFSLASLEPTAVSKIISPHQSKKDMPGDHYYLFVDLPKAEDVDLAVQMLDGIEPSWGGKVRVRRAKVNQDRKVMREQFGDKASEDDANKG